MVWAEDGWHSQACLRVFLYDLPRASLSPLPTGYQQPFNLCPTGRCSIPSDHLGASLLQTLPVKLLLITENLGASVPTANITLTYSSAVSAMISWLLPVEPHTLVTAGCEPISELSSYRDKKVPESIRPAGKTDIIQTVAMNSLIIYMQRNAGREFSGHAT